MNDPVRTTVDESSASPEVSSAAFAHEIGDIILDKKGDNLVVIDVAEVTSLADYLVIASGSNKRQVQSLAAEIEARAKAKGVTRLSTSGADQGWWVLVDFGFVLVHLMQEDAREFYDLEMLWGDGQVVRRSAEVA